MSNSRVGQTGFRPQTRVGGPVSTIKAYVFNASGGETSVSGADSNSQTLSYTPGFELVFLNGVLLVRNSDYTATTGTSIAGLTALSAGDVLEIVSYVSAYTVGNALTQAYGDATYALKNDAPLDEFLLMGA